MRGKGLEMLKKSKILTIIALATSLTACGGGGSSKDADEGQKNLPSVIAEQPIVPEVPTTNVEPPQSSINQPVKNQSLNEIYIQKPNLKNCQAGQLTLQAKQSVLSKVNEIRALHGLGRVSYDEESSEQMMQTALMMSANQQLDHYPLSSWKCYSATGAAGAASSNLYMIRGRGFTESITTLENDIVAWLIDENVESSGHRRWLLDPFLTRVAYGSVSDMDSVDKIRASSLKVIYSNNNAAVAKQEVIAYPMGNYPKAYFKDNAYLSVSILDNAVSSSANKNIDYSAATVKVVLRGDIAQEIRSLSYSNNGMGLPNHLQFKLSQVKENAIYDVYLDNVRVNGVPRQYSYWFKLQ